MKDAFDPDREAFRRSLSRAWREMAEHSTAGETPGGRVEYFGEIGSTNDRVRELAALLEPEGAIVVADSQTRGRGRSGRSWHSPGGAGVYLSLLLRPKAEATCAPLFGLLAAVAAAEALSPFAAAAVSIKWPNDLMIERAGPLAGGRRKVAGILAEARTIGDRIADVVIGMGVNVSQSEGDFPREIATRATSLRISAGAPVERRAVATSLVEQVARWYTIWRTQGSSPVLRAYRSLAPDLCGRRVMVTDGASGMGGMRGMAGTTAGMEDDGALRIVDDPADGGRSRLIRYGDLRRVEEET